MSRPTEQMRGCNVLCAHKYGRVQKDAHIQQVWCRIVRMHEHQLSSRDLGSFVSHAQTPHTTSAFLPQNAMFASGESHDPEPSSSSPQNPPASHCGFPAIIVAPLPSSYESHAPRVISTAKLKIPPASISWWARAKECGQGLRARANNHCR